MWFAFFFISNRIGQIVTLTPIVGMLGWFVAGYSEVNSLTPTSILVLFIVSTLALPWALFTLFSYARTSRNANFVSLIDALFFGALIAGVYFLRGIASADCTDVTFGSDDWTVGLGDIQVTGPGVDIDWRTNKRCAMLKASFAFAIINIVLFFFTAIFAFSHGGGFGDHEETHYRSRGGHHSDRHSHRRSHSGSRHSHHSTSRRAYV